MAVIAVRSREILICLLMCSLFANCKAKTTQGNTDTKPCFEWDSHPRGRQWSSEVCSYCNILSANLVIFSLFWNAIIML